MLALRLGVIQVACGSICVKGLSSCPFLHPILGLHLLLGLLLRFLLAWFMTQKLALTA
ncbi:MAG: hypothetical protein ACJAVO_002149 [Parvibaculaceae bacterium]|jgi:hypothetical protein